MSKKLPLEQLKHGPTSRARYDRGCTCEVCYQGEVRRRPVYRVHDDRAMTPAERQARSRANLFGTPVPEGVKHGVYCRKVYGCQCEESREARAKSLRRARNRWRVTARGRWGNAYRDGHDFDTICWPPRDAGPDWQCPGCGSTRTSSHQERAA